MSKKGLYEKLIKYSSNGRYPFHMPGHKRQVRLFAQENKKNGAAETNRQVSGRAMDPYEIDITEIEGFDNLHHPQGIIRESMDNAASFFGTEQTWFLVNGSSCGLLAAINSVTNIGDCIMIGRNCHKAVYHAVEIRNLNTKYIYPEYLSEYGMNGGYKPEDIEKILSEGNDEIKAVVITSPTYDGVVSDIKRIAEIVHKFHCVLIVDEAHGAHLGIHENLPRPAYQLGADIVIESVHKTLPAMTQTAMIHLCGDRVCKDRLQNALAIYQTSSPSYVLMASIDQCIRKLQEEGKELLEQLLITLDKFRDKVNNLKCVKVAGRELIGNNSVYDFDITKLVIRVDGIDGKELEDILRNKYHIEMEMTSARYVLGITTMCDDMEQILRLAEILKEIDEQIVGKSRKKNDKEDFCLDRLETAMSIYKAISVKSEVVELQKAKNRISAGYLYVYPPENPIVVPGEMISKGLIEKIDKYKEIGLNLKGMVEDSAGKIKVIKSEELF